MVVKHVALRFFLELSGCRLFLELGQMDHLSQQTEKSENYHAYLFKSRSDTWGDGK